MTDLADPLARFITGITFRFLPPERGLPGGYGGLRRFLRWFGVYVDVLNTCLPADSAEEWEHLRAVVRVPRMSTIAIAAIVNRAVGLMPESQAYLNIGVWNGFTFLSGVSGHPDRLCIGVDNFCKFGGPREAFQERFARLTNRNLLFHGGNRA